MSKIIKLEVANIKRLKAVELTPEGKVIVVGGRNGQGKTSLLDAIAYAFGGKSALCDEPVRRGEEYAYVICTLDDLIVKREFKKDGSSVLTVTGTDGSKYPSPQSMVDKLWSKLGFDPLAFSREKPLEQLETLRGVLGLDFTKLDAQRKAFYTDRALKGRDVTGRKTQIETLPHYPDAPAKEPVVLELVNELEAAQAVNGQAADVAKNLKTRSEELTDLQQEMVDLKDQLIALKDRIESKEQIVNAQQDRVSNSKTIDTEPIKDKIANAEAVQKQVQANAARAAVQEHFNNAKEAYDTLTVQIEDIDDEKAELVKGAKFPIEGLGMGDDGVTYGGFPFAQASSAEQLRVSVAMGLALNPELKLLLIRDGSLLDEDSMRMIYEMAEKSEGDPQIFIERVGSGAECQIVIEDGSVVEAEKGSE